MKITFKDPDAVYNAMQEEASDQIEAIEGLEDDEKDDLIQGRKDKISDMLSEWIEYDEYITIDFDLENKTATVVRR